MSAHGATTHEGPEGVNGASSTPIGTEGRTELWVRRGCALVVASVAAYASYVHQRAFALQGGADTVSATLWPLSVDGLLLLATVGLLNPVRRENRRARTVIWLAFLLGIAVSLAANVAAAPSLEWKPMLVAGWPPVALLLSVELLAHRPDRLGHNGIPYVRAMDTTETRRAGDQLLRQEESETEALRLTESDRETNGKPLREVDDGATVSGDWDSARAAPKVEPQGDRAHPSGRTAEQVMWAHYRQQLAAGRVPSGAELDRAAGTNNYGRSVLARWRRAGRIPTTADRKRLPRGPDRSRGE